METRSQEGAETISQDGAETSSQDRAETRSQDGAETRLEALDPLQPDQENVMTDSEQMNDRLTCFCYINRILL